MQFSLYFLTDSKLMDFYNCYAFSVSESIFRLSIMFFLAVLLLSSKLNNVHVMFYSSHITH